MPRPAQNLIDRRLAPLSSPARTVVAAAALIGSVFELPVLEQVMAMPPDAVLAAVEEAVEAGVVVDHGFRFTFVNDLVRQAAAAIVLPTRRGRLHVLISQATGEDSPAGSATPA